MTRRHLYILLLLAAALMFGCEAAEKEPTPKDTFQIYINSWQNNDFNGMYGTLCDNSRNTISQEDFIQKYSTIYKGIEVKDLQVSADFTKEPVPDKEMKVRIPYSVKMDTMAGEISYSSFAELKQEKLDEKKKAWRLVWDTTMVFPGLLEGEKIKVEKLQGTRGEIRDRNGKLLAANGIAAEVGIVPGKFDGLPATKEAIAKILDISASLIDKKLSASYVKADMFIPIKSIPSDDKEKKAALLKIKGIMINDRKARVYPLGEKAAHLTGSIHAVSAEELEKIASDLFGKDDVIGKSGLEKIYEKSLRPKAGAEIYIVDKEGKKKKTLAVKEAENGEDLRITIDSDMQSSLYDELKEDASVGVALNPKTGEALALVSTPSYNPNSFVLGISDKEWKALNDNPKKPLSNRFSRTFCPGSTFKPVTAAIALKAGKLDPEAVKDIKGLKWQKGKGWGNYHVTRVSEYKEPPNLFGAMIHSDNIYFAQVALDIGKEVFQSEVRNFGIGEKIPFEYGLYNSQFDTDGVIKEEVQLADSGYGQGQVLMNPVHLAAIYSSFVNNGDIIKPFLMFQESPSPEVWKEKVIPEDVANKVLSILAQVVENPGGTGHQAWMKELPIAGKTGTAEIKINSEDKKGTELGWFAGVSPSNPKLLVLSMVEDVKDRGGSHYVVPKVKKIFEQYGK